MRALFNCPKHNYNDQSKQDEMGRARSTRWGQRNAYGVLVRKPEGRRPLGRGGREYEDIIKMDRRGIVGWYGLGCSGSR
jgi:hypothetical protein